MIYTIKAYLNYAYFWLTHSSEERERILDEADDAALLKIANERLNDGKEPIEVDIKDLL